jgi:hypothetical protein
MHEHVMGTNVTARASGEPTSLAPAPVYNARGIIAEHYRDLQGLPVLEAARFTYPLPRASAASTMRAVFQAVELALLNLADVTARAADDLESGAQGSAVVKQAWARGFHRVLVRLSTMPAQLGLSCGDSNGGSRLRISDSPALREFLQALKRFDAALAALIDEGHIDLERLIGDASLDTSAFQLLHLARVSNHEATVWEANLADVPVAAEVPSYETFVVSKGMRDAVYDRVLTGDSYFTQFRGLHQIPETLGEEANDRLEQAIRHLRARETLAALEHLRCVTVLTDGMLAAVPPMADNLATSDYHQIRENLGLTSGSHSVCLRFHLFGDLYGQLWEVLAHNVLQDAPRSDGINIEQAFRAVDEVSTSDTVCGHYHLVMNEFLTLRAFVGQWRDQHLHMPRNNLGGGDTKSLAGSPDALTAVKQMRQRARTVDPMLPLARARGLATHVAADATLPLHRHFEAEDSLDSRILAATGAITQARFADVQGRLGYFAKRCPFTPPPRRRVE